MYNLHVYTGKTIVEYLSIF